MAVLLVLAIALGIMGVWGWSLVDMLGRPEHQYKAIGHDRTLWLLGVLFVGVPASIAYLLIARPKLAQVASLPAATGYPMLNAAPPPGWYPDPQGMQVMRWFDGRQWTAQTAAMGSVPMGGLPLHPGAYAQQPGPAPYGHPGAAPPPQYPYPPAR